MFRLLSLCLFVALATGCSEIKVDDYRDYEPKLVLEEFFKGQLTAHGTVKDRAGLVIRTFNADIAASWENGVGTLVEDFIFDDGELQQRIWTLTPNGEGSYIGTAGDVIGDGQLNVAGNSLFLKYILRIPYRDSTLDLVVDDRMYLVSPDVLLNESSMIKFGIEVGSINLVILRRADDRGISN